MFVFWVNWPFKSLLRVRVDTVSGLWHNDGSSTSGLLCSVRAGGTGCDEMVDVNGKV